MRFYGFGHREVMALPIRMFWVYVRQLERVQARELMDTLHVGNAAQGGEAAETLVQQLRDTVGTTVVPDVVVDELDRDGLEELRKMI